MAMSPTVYCSNPLISDLPLANEYLEGWKWEMGKHLRLACMIPKNVWDGNNKPDALSQ